MAWTAERKREYAREWARAKARREQRQWVPRMLLCGMCQTTFVADRWTQKFCSIRCRYRAKYLHGGYDRYLAWTKANRPKANSYQRAYRRRQLRELQAQEAKQ